MLSVEDMNHKYDISIEDSIFTRIAESVEDNRLNCLTEMVHVADSVFKWITKRLSVEDSRFTWMTEMLSVEDNISTWMTEMLSVEDSRFTLIWCRLGPIADLLESQNAISRR